MVAFVQSCASSVALADHWARLIDSAQGRCSTHITGMLVVSRFEGASHRMHDFTTAAIHEFTTRQSMPVLAARYEDIAGYGLLGCVYRMRGEPRLVSPLDFWQHKGRAARQPYEKQVSLMPRHLPDWGRLVFKPVPSSGPTFGGDR